MSVIKVAILGFGTVGEGVYRTIHSHADELAKILGKKVEVAAVLIKNKQKKRSIQEDVLITTDFEEILNIPDLNVVVEAIVGKEPSFSFLKQAIEKGCHIITANKEMFAHYSKELFELAERQNVSVGFEATVGGGIPIIQTLRQLLKVNRVQQIQGILNGTSNFILTEMREKKLSFAAALLKAQENGFAEVDPTNDVEGFDAFFKSMILSRIAFGVEPNWKSLEREGITSITSELITAAESLGLRFKHIACLQKQGNQIYGTVKPALVGKDHPFYHVEGVENAVSVCTDIVGRITLQGPGAGMFPSASAVIEDLVYVYQNKSSKLEGLSNDAAQQAGKVESSNELWLLTGVAKKLLNPAIAWVEKVAEGTYVVETTQKELKQLTAQREEMVYFPIIGSYQSSQNQLEETRTAL